MRGRGNREAARNFRTMIRPLGLRALEGLDYCKMESAS